MQEVALSAGVHHVGIALHDIKLRTGLALHFGCPTGVIEVCLRKKQ